jgi:hypothetical protein
MISPKASDEERPVISTRARAASNKELCLRTGQDIPGCAQVQKWSGAQLQFTAPAHDRLCAVADMH